MMTNRIIVEEVRKGFVNDEGELNLVLDGLSLELPQGTFATLVGPNGCGKSTLLNLVAGLTAPDSGQVTITTSDGEAPRIGYVWQNYRESLLPWLTVGENVCFPLRVQGVGRSVRRKVAQAALEGFSADIQIDQKVYSLSGGQQQLICLLRSSVSNPHVLLLDEPLSALDQPTRWTMAFRIEQLWMKSRMAALFVSHDVDEAVMLSDRVLLMSRNGGRIAEVVENLLPRPRNVQMLSSAEHIGCRNAVIEFLFAQGAIRESTSQRNDRPTGKTTLDTTPLQA